MKYYIDEKWPLLTSSTFEPEKRGLQSRIEELIAEFQFLEEFFNRDDAEDVLKEYIEKVDMENADVKSMPYYIAEHMTQENAQHWMLSNYMNNSKIKIRSYWFKKVN